MKHPGFNAALARLFALLLCLAAAGAMTIDTNGQTLDNTQSGSSAVSRPNIQTTKLNAGNRDFFKRQSANCRYFQTCSALEGPINAGSDALLAANRTLPIGTVLTDGVIHTRTKSDMGD